MVPVQHDSKLLAGHALVQHQVPGAVAEHDAVLRDPLRRLFRLCRLRRRRVLFRFPGNAQVVQDTAGLRLCQFLPVTAVPQVFHVAFVGVEAVLDQHCRRHRPFQHIQARFLRDGGGPYCDPRRLHCLQDALRRGIAAAGLAEHVGAPPGGRGPAVSRRRVGVQAHEQVQSLDVVGDLAPLGQARRLTAGPGHGHGHAVPLQDGADPVPHVQGELVLIVGPVRALVGQVARVVARVQTHRLLVAHRCFLRFSVVQVQQDQVLAGVLALDQHVLALHVQVDLAAAIHHHGELAALAHHVVPQVLRRHGAAGTVRGPVGDPGVLGEAHGHPAPPAAHVVVVVQLLLGPSRPDQQAVCHVVSAVALPARGD